jgi:hypothetical protein
MSQQTTTVRKSLTYHFTKEEKAELSHDLATQNQRLRDIKNQKNAANAHYASQTKEAEELISSLSDKVTSGFELREVDCLVEYHAPERNKKTLTRSDTGEHWVEPMGDADFNLFNQYAADSEQAEVEAEAVRVDDAPAGEDEDKPKRRKKVA